jgi:hypothetical protein
MTLTHIDGKAIIERQPATAMPGSIAQGATISSVEQLLLEDGTVLFHCIHKNAKDCEYVNVVLGGVTSHQRTHSDRMEAKRAQEKAAELAEQLAEIERQKAAKKANYSAGAKKGAETKAAKRVQVPVEVGGAGRRNAEGTPSKSVVGDPELARKAQQVIIAYNALQTAHDEFQNVFLGYMRAAQNVSETVAIDPEILEKAKKYDALKGMLA